jgi:2-C-methyl-D-erythritol 4-phosphate cytidylyltransferase/2-C-methyl-D-erythritol 2,4-cyclodiphosphate synthase
VAGGARRQDSVAAGVAATSARVILVHDGARPIVDASVVEAVARAADERGAAIPTVPAHDALKRVSGDRIEAGVDRGGIVRAQTPQGARRDLLVEALGRHVGGADVADEAELLALAGVDVTVVDGDPANVKITLPGDLDLVRRLVGPSTTAHGHGWDSHPFGPGDGLRLGGLHIERAPRLAGHSDGDVVLHALCDALLGAAGLEDVGRLFPSGAPETAGVDSAILVTDVARRIATAGLATSQVGVTIRGARPRLGAGRLEAMRIRIAGLVGLDTGRVGVTASTGNLSGDEGAGRVISADCHVVLARR